VSHVGGLTWARVVVPPTVEKVSTGRDVFAYFDVQGDTYYSANDRDGPWVTHSSHEGRTWSAATLLPGAKGFDQQHDLESEQTKMKPWKFVCMLLCIFFEPGIAFAQANQIHVGPNVHVSQAHANYSLGEVLLSADPADANRLLGCGVLYAESENRRWTVVYLSTDGGKTWQPTLETKRFEDSADPACALGRSGLASQIAIGVTGIDPETKKTRYALGVHRSTDGGKTWTQQEDMPMNFQGIDRESLTIDTTQGKFGNRIYITGESYVRDLSGKSRNGLAFWCSRDGGVTFEGPFKRETIANHYVLQPGNSVVLSDGTLVSVFGDLKNYDSNRDLVERNTPEESNAVLESITITEGGDTFSEAVKVDDFFMVWDHKDGSMSTIGMPTLAADSGDGPFRDRLYATWGDERDGRSEIRLAYSSDKGKTWSRSMVIDDVLGPPDNKKGPQNFLPTVAVNKAGVVAVTWYDRRDNPDGLGWYIRLRTSLDGGDTWLPSVRVSEKPNTFSSASKLFTYANAKRSEGATSGSGREIEDEAAEPCDKKEKTKNPTHVNIDFQDRQFFAGDYAGLAADAGGTFHAWWIDNRTGLAQIWSAPITVDGKAIRNGDVTLSELKDVSGDVDLKIVSSNYDRGSNKVALGVRLKNSSKKSIRGPVKLRLVNISSAIGSPSAVNADNQLAQPGAVWDFSPLLKDNVLKPDETSAVKQLLFRVDHPRDFFEGKSLHYDLLKFDIRMLAAGAEPQVKPVTEKAGSAN
jgi:hypothetical protein